MKQQLLPPKPVLHMEKSPFKYDTRFLEVMDSGICEGRGSGKALELSRLLPRSHRCKEGNKVLEVQVRLIAAAAVVVAAAIVAAASTAAGQGTADPVAIAAEDEDQDDEDDPAPGAAETVVVAHK